MLKVTCHLAGQGNYPIANSSTAISEISGTMVTCIEFYEMKVRKLYTDLYETMEKVCIGLHGFCPLFRTIKK